MKTSLESWKQLLAAAEVLSGKMPSTGNLAHFHAKRELIALRESIKEVSRSAGVPADHEFDENGKCIWCPEERASQTEEGSNT